MKCKTIRRNLPLYIGGELAKKKRDKVEAHIQVCGECQQELAIYKDSVSAIKAWVKQEQKEWQEDSWVKAVNLATREEPESKKALWPWPYKPVWAYAFMVVFLIAFSVFLLKPFPFGEEVLSLPEMAEASQQDIVSVTLVSKETGFQVQWFFNRNYNLEEEIE